MIIVAIDNFDRDWIDEQLIDQCLTEQKAKEICKAHNDAMPPNGQWYWVVKPDGYKLRQNVL